MGKKNKDKPRKNKKKHKLTAATADKFNLYEKSVQDPPSDVRFMVRTYKKERGKEPKVLREDFCGTAKLCAAWVKKKPDRKAMGIDLDQPTLDYGRAHHLAALDGDAIRVNLVNQNVLDPAPNKADVIAAFNFSYCIFKERTELLAYAQNAHDGLKPGGALFMDIHGGTESFIEVEEETKHKGFTYVWEQAPYDAINGLRESWIHFRFKDGTKMKKAFYYDWRIWSLPELRDILYDAGFKRVDVYWEGADKNGEGDGVFKKTKSAENEDSWIAYVVGWR